MAGEITSATSTLDYDREKFLASKLLQRSMLKLVCGSVCDKVAMPQGAGLTAYFVRYARMNVPLTTLTEGTDPANSSFSLEQVTVTLDQWGDVITLTDVAQLATSHPLLQQAVELLSDNAQRVIDREIQIVWLAGTNVIYGDGSVASRATVTAAMKISDTLIHKARVTLSDAGAPPRSGPSNPIRVESSGTITQGNAYVAICGPQVMADVQVTAANYGTWASVAMYANQKALYNAEVGTWLGLRWVETNFIPKFAMFGNTTEAVASAAAFGTGTPTITAVNGGGSLTSAATYFWKVVRKLKTRGFAEDISIAHSTAAAAAGNDESFSFAFPAGATYVYDLYFDKTAGGGTSADSNLGLVQANIAASATVVVTAAATSSTTAPANVNTTGTPTIHPVYIHGAESCNWVSLQNLQTFMTKDESIIGNVLKLKRAIGYKFLAKTMIRDQTRLLRLEVASSY